MTATVSSHVLNAVDGSHAGGVRVMLGRLSAMHRDVLFETRTDPGGRLVQQVDLTDAAPGDRYELVFATGAYWHLRQAGRDTLQILHEVVFRFEMPDPARRYHIPLITAPNSYSVWWSS